MSDHTDPVPTEIKLHQRSRCLEIAFADGNRFHLACKYLRVFSPAAEVKAAKNRGERVTCDDAVNITAIEPVGSYAVNLKFDDGHDTGIYSWRSLYELGRDYDRNWQSYLNELTGKGSPVGSNEPQGTAHRQVHLLYFMSLVNELGRDSETLVLTEDVKTMADLLGFLRTRGDAWHRLLVDERVTMTVNKKFVDPSAPISDGDEIALVPKPLL